RMERDTLGSHPPRQAEQDPVERPDPLREDDSLRQSGGAAAVDDVVRVIAAHADRGRRVVGRADARTLRAVARTGRTVAQPDAVRPAIERAIADAVLLEDDREMIRSMTRVLCEHSADVQDRSPGSSSAFPEL